MAFSKKKKRKIVVAGKVYYWSMRQNDFWQHLCVMTELAGSPKLSCHFGYYYRPLKVERAGIETEILANQFVVTPYTVRQVILYALALGWKPFEKGKDLRLGDISDKIELRLDQDRATNEKKFWLDFSVQQAQKADPKGHLEAICGKS